MSRLLVLLIFAVWLTPLPAASPWMALPASAAALSAGYIVLIGLVALRARSIAARVGEGGLSADLRRFNRLVSWARIAIPIWLGIAIFSPIAWRTNLLHALFHLHPMLGFGGFEVPGLFAGTLPALLAWVAMWWAQYPADRALREQSLLSQIEHSLPIHAPPTLRRYLLLNFRMQLAFLAVPVLLVLLAHDVLMAILSATGYARSLPPGWDELLMLPAAAAVFIFSPLILGRLLGARPLPDSALRRRLESICRHAGLRYRDLLLWPTDYTVGNALVMGVLPRLRYIILSDLLLETMNDQQIEAVFAHEAGHIVYRHLAWYALFFAILTLTAMGLGQTLETLIAPTGVGQQILDTASSVGTLVAVMLLFGTLSRRFERQADVYAARMIESDWGRHGGTGSAEHRNGDATYVGEYGAGVFASALHRVAVVNSIPVRARDWWHGSISMRMEYLLALSANPERTHHFDRLMCRLYRLLLLALLLSGAWAALAMTTLT